MQLRVPFVGEEDVRTPNLGGEVTAEDDGIDINVGKGQARVIPKLSKIEIKREVL